MVPSPRPSSRVGAGCGEREKMGAAGALSHITVWTRWALVPCNPYGMSGIVYSVCDNRAPFMKRKIAAIMAADIAGYSKLVAEDEEETLRRLRSEEHTSELQSPDHLVCRLLL